RDKQGLSWRSGARDGAGGRVHAAAHDGRLEQSPKVQRSRGGQNLQYNPLPPPNLARGLVMRTADRSLFCVVACLALLLALPTPGLAQAKIRVAIWEFENHAEHHWWFYNDLGPAARNQIDTEFAENTLLSSKFSVIERDKLNLVLKEQGLAMAGAVDPTTAAKVG